MIRVLHVMRSLKVGGIGAFVMNVYRKIDKTQIQFDFALTNSGMGAFGEEIESLGGKIYFLSEEGNRGLGDGIKQVKNLYSLCKKKHYTVVHCHYYFANAWFLMAAKYASIPVRVSHCHNAGEVVKVNILRSLFRIVSRKLLLSKGTVFLGCSRAASEFLYGKKAVKSGRAKVLYNGIDYEIFDLGKYDKESIRKKYQVDDNHICIFIGRYEDQKNPIFALSIFNAVHKDIHNLQFFMVGYGTKEEEIKEYIRSNNLEKCVRLLPPNSDVAELQVIADIMLSPSKWEGLSIAFIEAQKMKTLVIASNCISQEVDMGYCEFVPTSDQERWIRVVKESINDSLVNRCYDNEKYSRFNINTTVKSLMNYYGVEKMYE